jgi:hypothetical protein
MRVAMPNRQAAGMSEHLADGNDRSATRRTYLVERFWPGVTPALAEEAAGRLRAAAAGSADRSVVHLGSALLPADEVVFTFVEADSASAVRELSERAAFAVDRISESISIGTSSGRDG